MATLRTTRDPLFLGRWFQEEVCDGLGKGGTAQMSKRGKENRKIFRTALNAY
jgi:hypothetical protein